MKRIFLSIILLILFVGARHVVPVSAQDAKKNTAAPAQTINMDEIKLTCDSLTVDDKNKILLMKNCRIEGKDITVTAPFARYDIKAQSGAFTGGVRAVHRDTVITSDRMNLFYTKKEAVLEGNAVLNTLRTNDKNTKDRYILKCDQLDFFWEKEEGWAYGKVHIIQKDAQAFCDKAHYSKSSRVAHLIGSVRFLKKGGDWLTAQEAWVDLDKETFLADKDVEGRFYIPKAKEEVKPSGGGTPQLKEIDIKPEPVTVSE